MGSGKSWTMTGILYAFLASMSNGCALAQSGHSRSSKMTMATFSPAGGRSVPALSENALEAGFCSGDTWRLPLGADTTGPCANIMDERKTTERSVRNVIFMAVSVLDARNRDL